MEKEGSFDGSNSALEKPDDENISQVGGCFGNSDFWPNPKEGSWGNSEKAPRSEEEDEKVGLASRSEREDIIE